MVLGGCHGWGCCCWGGRGWEEEEVFGGAAFGEGGGREDTQVGVGGESREKVEHSFFFQVCALHRVVVVWG